MKMLMIKNAEEALRKLVMAELPIKTAFEVSSTIDSIEPHLKKFEEFRVNLVQKYGSKTDKGFEVLGDNIEKFNEEIQLLLNAEVNIDIHPIHVNDILGNDSIKMSVRDIKALESIGMLVMK